MLDSLHPPPSVVASWPAPNYVDPVTRGNSLFVIVTFLTVLAIFTVAARIWARFVLVRETGLDDGLILLALVFGIAFSVTIIIVTTKYGDGHHAWDVPPSKRELSRLYTWFAEWFFILSSTITKFSILLFYKRLVAGSYSRRFIWATRVGIYFNGASATAFCLLLLLECRPMNAYWKAFGLDYKKPYTCTREEISLPISGLFSVASDLYATLLPFLLLRRLQIPSAQKMALYGIFSLGSLAIISGIMRTIFLYIALNATWDLTWHVWETWIWAAVEVYVAIICASAPALKPFFAQVFRNQSSRHGYARSRTQKSFRATESSQESFNLSSASRRDCTSSVYVKGTKFDMMRVVTRAEYSPPSPNMDKLDDDCSPLDSRVHTPHSVYYDQVV